MATSIWGRSWSATNRWSSSISMADPSMPRLHFLGSGIWLASRGRPGGSRARSPHRRPCPTQLVRSDSAASFRLPRRTGRGDDGNLPGAPVGRRDLRRRWRRFGCRRFPHRAQQLVRSILPSSLEQAPLGRHPAIRDRTRTTRKDPDDSNRPPDRRAMPVWPGLGACVPGCQNREVGPPVPRAFGNVAPAGRGRGGVRVLGAGALWFPFLPDWLPPGGRAPGKPQFPRTHLRVRDHGGRRVPTRDPGRLPAGPNSVAGDPASWRHRVRLRDLGGRAPVGVVHHRTRRDDRGGPAASRPDPACGRLRPDAVRRAWDAFCQHFHRGEPSPPSPRRPC
jgi:hypothetical protein